MPAHCGAPCVLSHLCVFEVNIHVAPIMGYGRPARPEASRIESKKGKMATVPVLIIQFQIKSLHWVMILR